MERNVLAMLVPLVAKRPPYEYHPFFSDTTTTVFKDGSLPEGRRDDWETGLLVWEVSAKRLPTKGVPAAQFVALRARVRVYDITPNDYTDPGVRVFYRSNWVSRGRVREGVVLHDGMVVVVGNKPFQVVIPKEVPA